MYGQSLCVCVCARACVCVMHVKVIVSKSLMTEGVKNRLFLVLLAGQDFSTSEHIFSRKHLYLTYAVVVHEKIIPTQISTSQLHYGDLWSTTMITAKWVEAVPLAQALCYLMTRVGQEFSHLLSPEKQHFS